MNIKTINQLETTQSVEGMYGVACDGEGNTKKYELHTSGVAKYIDNPIINLSRPDPTVWNDNKGVFYLLPTGFGRHIYHSNDLVHWSDIGFQPFENDTYSLLKTYGNNLWAPHVIKLNNQYIMYISTKNDEDNRTCIHVCTSLLPFGRFKYVNTLVDSTELCAIDPFVTLNTDGNIYMFYGSDNGIYRQ